MDRKRSISEQKLRELAEASCRTARFNLEHNVSVVADLVSRTLKMGHITSADRDVLEIASENIMFGNDRLNHSLEKLRSSDFELYSSILNAVSFLTSGLINGCNRSSLPESAERLVKSRGTVLARNAAVGMQEHRDLVLRRKLGPLLEKGLKGEKLRQALIEAFVSEKVETRKAQPGLRRVQDWVKEYRDLGMWRPDTKS